MVHVRAPQLTKMLAPNQSRGKESVEPADVGARLHESSRIDDVSKLVSTRHAAIDSEIGVAREKSIDHAFALFGRDTANRIHDRAARTHERRARCRASAIESQPSAPESVGLSRHFISGCSRSVPSSGARRVEEHVPDARRRKRRRRGQIGANELDIAMPQAVRQVARILESVEIEVHGDHSTAFADHLREMSRLATRRRRTIDDGRAGSATRASARPSATPRIARGTGPRDTRATRNAARRSARSSRARGRRAPISKPSAVSFSIISARDPRARFSLITLGAASLFAVIRRSAFSTPNQSTNRSTIHRGCEYATAR